MSWNGGGVWFAQKGNINVHHIKCTFLAFFCHLDWLLCKNPIRTSLFNDHKIIKSYFSSIYFWPVWPILNFKTFSASKGRHVPLGGGPVNSAERSVCFFKNQLARFSVIPCGNHQSKLGREAEHCSCDQAVYNRQSLQTESWNRAHSSPTKSSKGDLKVFSKIWFIQNQFKNLNWVF